MNHVIIEGPDGAGKTTLAKRLVNAYGYGYHHEGPPPPDTSVLQHYGSLLATRTRPTVFDRLHLGELVYGPLLRGESKLDASAVTLLQRVVDGLGTQVVICLPPFGTCMDNLHEHEHIKDAELLAKAYDRWRCCAAEELDAGRAILHDYVSWNDSMLPFWTERPRCPRGVYGSPTARFLFVGERVSGELDVPFLSLEHSSGYLFEALRIAGFSEHECAWTNAYNVEGDARDLRRIAQQLPNFQWAITLGREAEYQCATQLVPHWSVPHPSYWKRFHHYEINAYAEKLRQVKDLA